MRPLLSIESLMVLGMETRETEGAVFFFLGFSVSLGVLRERCFRWYPEPPEPLACLDVSLPVS
jgi:hypothetical protein